LGKGRRWQVQGESPLVRERAWKRFTFCWKCGGQAHLYGKKGNEGDSPEKGRIVRREKGKRGKKAESYNFGKLANVRYQRKALFNLGKKARRKGGKNKKRDSCPCQM